MCDQNESSTGWYIGSYLLRFVEDRDPDKNEQNARFATWENTVIVKSENITSAYKKVEEIGKINAQSYKGGAKKTPVSWIYEGIVDLVPIYEELEDGSEILWKEFKPRKLKNIRKQIRSLEELKDN